VAQFIGTRGSEQADAEEALKAIGALASSLANTSH